MLDKQLDYEWLGVALERAGMDAEPAEVQGMICAQLTVQPAAALDDWLQDEFRDEAGEGVELSGVHGQLGQLWDAAREGLLDGGLGLKLLLPEDGKALVLRTSALMAWCEGYLYCLGLAGTRALKPMSPEAREFIADLTEVTSLDTGGVVDEQAEAAYREIVEYIRVGVMMVYRDLVPGSGARLPSSGMSLH